MLLLGVLLESWDVKFPGSKCIWNFQWLHSWSLVLFVLQRRCTGLEVEDASVDPVWLRLGGQRALQVPALRRRGIERKTGPFGRCQDGTVLNSQ